MKEMAFKFYKQNLKGRDFVVGDIHGQFSALEMLLLEVAFNPARDRVFSVGDMIDRGPESHRVVEFLNYPWFHAILGNHEQMLLDSEHSDAVLKNWTEWNGGDWWSRIPARLHERIRRIIAKLPLAMEVDTAQGRVGIVHADVPIGFSWQHFVAQISNNDTQNDVKDHALWSRNRFKQLQMMGRTHPIDGIDLVVFGHTPVPKALQQANLYYIDTGASYVKDKQLGTMTLLEITPDLQLHTYDTHEKQTGFFQSARSPKQKRHEHKPNRYAHA